MELKNEKLSEDAFFAERKEVLEQWPTGKDVKFEEAIAYHKSIPAEKVFGSKLHKAQAEGITLTQPRAGVALFHEHIKLLQYLETEGESGRTNIHRLEAVNQLGTM